MNRINLLSSTMAIPVGPSRFFPMRQQAAEEGGGGGNESPPAKDNTGGNSGESDNQNSDEDNNGQKDELAGFWETPEDEEESDDSEDDSVAASQALGAELKTAIEGFAPKPLFTKEIAEAIAEGNFDGANEALVASHRATIQQSLMLTAKMVGAVAQRMQADFDQRIQSALGNTKNTEFLESEFPLAKNAQYRPMVERVWNQALKNSKGDRQKAIRMTRGMLEAFGSDVAPNLRDAPDDPTAGINTAASKSLVASLLDRG